MSCRAMALVVLFQLAALSPLRSQQIQTGLPISGLELQNLRGHTQTLHLEGGRATAVLFFSTRCPLSSAFNHRRNVLYHDFHAHVRFLLVDPNANESLDEVRAYAKQSGFDIPVYRDPEGRVAALLAIRATTDSVVVDEIGTMRYRGNIENAPNPERATEHGLRAALEAVVTGQPVRVAETRSIGCAVRRLKPMPQAVSSP